MSKSPSKMPAPKHLSGYLVNTLLDACFEPDLLDVHLIYDYNAEDSNGNPQKWRYETWFASRDRVVYSIHGGPMHERQNFQRAVYQCVRPGHIWQANWLEETGTIVSLVHDIQNKTIMTLCAFSKGHRGRAEEAHGDKRKKEDLHRWRGLAADGKQTERMVMAERAEVLECFKKRGKLPEIDPNAERL
jgi:hypothetical protein